MENRIPAATGSEEDQRLIEALQSRSQQGFEHFAGQYQKPLIRLVARMIPDQTAAVDVVQQVFLRVFQRIGGFRGDCPLRTWVYRLAILEAKRYRRWHSRNKALEVAIDASDPSAMEASAAHTLVDRGPSAAELLFESEIRDLVYESLAGINPAFRQAVKLRALEELSYEEIGDALQINIGTVKSRILRGHDQLRVQLFTIGIENLRGLYA